MNLKLLIELFFHLELELYFNTYRIGDNPNNLIKLKNTKFKSGAGDHYLVFEYLKEVIKIHRTSSGEKEIINEDNLKALSQKKTKRILMPDELVYNDDTNECVGYTMPLINNKKHLIEESIEHFLNEMNLVRKDADYLTKELVVLNDLHGGNYIYNGAINIIDCGNFDDCYTSKPAYLFLDMNLPIGLSFDDALEKYYDIILEKIRTTNNNGINDLFLTILLNEYDYEYGKDIKRYINYLMKEAKITNIDDFIETTKERDMTVDDYIAVLARKLNGCNYDKSVKRTSF